MMNVAAAVSGRPVDVASARESLELYSALGDLRGLARAHNILGMCAYFIGHWDEALDHYAASESAYLKVGRRFDAAIVWANQAEILVDQQRFDEAEAVLREAMREWKAAKALGEIGFGKYLLGRVAARTGRFERAFELLADARADYIALGEAHEVLTVDALTAECHLLAGQPELAVDLAARTLAEIRQLDGVDNAVPVLERTRGTGLIALGHRELGWQALRASLAAARQRDAGHEVAATLGALLSAGAAEGDAAEGKAWERERSTLIAALGLVESQASVIC
jgi:tetratricopeptide (TPR) repeat protein